MEHKFKKTSRDHFLEQLLHVCGQFSSFSDACSSIVLTNFETIYKHLQDNLKAENVCHLSGQCSAQFHRHDDDKVLFQQQETNIISYYYCFLQID